MPKGEQQGYYDSERSFLTEPNMIIAYWICYWMILLTMIFGLTLYYDVSRYNSGKEMLIHDWILERREK